MGIFEGLRKERSSEWQGKMLSGLVRVLTEYEDDYLEEMLGMLKPLYGEESVLSIISLESREVLASTDTAVSEIEYMVRSIVELDRKCYYLRNEKNSIRYRKGINSIRVVPLTYRKSVSHVLIVEQDKNHSVVADRCMEILAIASHAYTVEQALEHSTYADRITSLPNRDALVRDISAITSDGVLYLGLLSIKRSAVLALGENPEGYENILSFVIKILKDVYGSRVYCIGEGLFSVFKKGRAYDCVAALQDVMDRCLVPNALPVKGTISVIDDDVLLALYRCEKACDGASSDAVVFIRDKDVDLNAVEESFYAGETIEREEAMEVEDVVYEEIHSVEPEGAVSDEERAVEEAEKDLTFFFDIPDVDDAFDDI